MDQLIFGSLSHTHYWYEVGTLKISVELQRLLSGVLPLFCFSFITNYRRATNRVSFDYRGTSRRLIGIVENWYVSHSLWLVGLTCRGRCCGSAKRSHYTLGLNILVSGGVKAHPLANWLMWTSSLLAPFPKNVTAYVMLGSLNLKNTT